MPDKVILDPYGRKHNLIFAPEDLARLHSFAEVVWARDEPIPEDQVAAHREDTVAIVTGSVSRYHDVSAFPRLRALLEVNGELPSRQSLDYAACFARGIHVLSCAPAFGPAVAEMGLGLAISAARQIVETAEAFRVGNENWSHENVGDTFLLYGKQVGLIGFGGLARALKPLLAPFRCPIQVYDPWLTDAYLRTQGVTPVTLERLLSTSRIIFVLATPAASNKALLDREHLQRISLDSVFVLLSRAHVVDFAALTEMIANRRFRAAIDVFPEEPLPQDHPIRQIPQVILSSHRAGAQAEALRNIGRIVVNDLEAILSGLPPHEMQEAQPEFVRLRG